MKKSKNILRLLSLIIVAVACAVFLIVFLMKIFSKPGDTVYVVSITGNVAVGSAADLNKVEPAYVGMVLSKGDIVATSDRSSCVLSYDKNADARSNFITVNKKSQVQLLSENENGGYNFFIADGSVICNMPNSARYSTVISTHNYLFYAENTIAKVDYDYQAEVGKVFVFDGNPNIKIVQPSGSEGGSERLLKNSVCAVQNMSDGTVGFGCLNTGFGLSEFSAQDLRTMSGIANTWTDRLSYSMTEFEQAFQTANDVADYTTTVAATLATTVEPVEIPDFSLGSFESVFTTDEAATEEKDVTTVATTSVSSVQTTTSFISQSSSTVSSTRVSETTATSNVTSTSLSREEPEETTTASTSRTSGLYVVKPSTTTQTTTASSVTTTVKTTTSKPTTTPAPAKTTAAKTTPTTTIPTVKVDPDATYTVIFVCNENGHEYWAMQLVKHGQAAIAPDVPEIEGKYFVKWDRDFSYVTSDMTINGIFADGKKSESKHTVNFYVNDTLWKTVSVKHGGSIKLDEEPYVDGKTFVGWSEDISNVTDDMTVFALFKSK